MQNAIIQKESACKTKQAKIQKKNCIYNAAKAEQNDTENTTIIKQKE